MLHFLHCESFQNPQVNEVSFDLRYGLSGFPYAWAISLCYEIRVGL